VSPRNSAKTSSQASARRACHRSPARSFRDVDELFEQSPYPARSAFDILTVMTTSVALSVVISRMRVAMTKHLASPARLAVPADVRAGFFGKVSGVGVVSELQQFPRFAVRATLASTESLTAATSFLSVCGPIDDRRQPARPKCAPGLATAEHETVKITAAGGKVIEGYAEGSDLAVPARGKALSQDIRQSRNSTSIVLVGEAARAYLIFFKRGQLDVSISLRGSDVNQNSRPV
jgi:hypothetical protein